MKRQSKTLTTREYFKVVRTLNHLRALGIEIVADKSKIKFILGGCLIGLGLLTLPIPATTPPLLTLGFLLMGLTKRDLILKQREVKALMKYLKQKDRGWKQ